MESANDSLAKMRAAVSDAKSRADGLERRLKEAQEEGTESLRQVSLCVRHQTLHGHRNLRHDRDCQAIGHARLTITVVYP